MRSWLICFLLITLTACNGGTSGSLLQPCNPCIIYGATNKGKGFNGNIKMEASILLNTTFNNGITAADALCNSDESKPRLPTNAVYRALLVDGVNRSWNPDINWIISPNTVYLNTSSSVIATSTESAIFSFPTESNLVMNIQFAWTGLGGGSTLWQAGTDNCNNWSSSDSSLWGNSGYEDYLTPAYARSIYQIYQGNMGCNLSQSSNLPIGLICIQQ